MCGACSATVTSCPYVARRSRTASARSSECMGVMLLTMVEYKTLQGLESLKGGVQDLKSLKIEYKTLQP